MIRIELTIDGDNSNIDLVGSKTSMGEILSASTALAFIDVGLHADDHVMNFTEELKTTLFEKMEKNLIRIFEDVDGN